MAISQKVRDRLLIEARHRCTICAEPAYELHHMIEQSQGGDDSETNLIVLCPNCHQQRVHRNKEFSLSQLKDYKLKLQEKNEVERRLLLNLEAIEARIEEVGLQHAEEEVRKELSEAAAQLDKSHSPSLRATIEQTATWLAQRGELKAGARRALEIECDLDIQRELLKWAEYAITSVDEDAWAKANDFPAAYRFVVNLSGTPYSQWRAVFDDEYRIALYSMKRKSRVVGNKLEMIVADSDNLQNHVNFLKQLVENTNTSIRDHLERRLEPHLRREKDRVLAEFDAIENLKSKTKGLIV